MFNNRLVRYLIRFIFLLLLLVLPLVGLWLLRPEWVVERPWLSAGYGVVVLFAAAGLAYLWYNRQEKGFFTRSRDVQRAFAHLVCLAELPPLQKTDSMPPLLSIHDDGEGAEAFQNLYASTRLAFTFSNQQYLFVTSANRGEGKTIVATNLAQTSAKIGKRVLLVEGHWDAPKVHDYFALTRKGHLASLLGRLAEKLQGYNDARSWSRLGELQPQIREWLDRSIQPTTQPNLFVLTNGAEPIPQALRQPILFRGVIDAALVQFDMIICDGPPMLTKEPDWQSLAVLGEVVVVAAAYNTRRAELHSALETLRRHPISPIGVVLNHRQPDATFPQPVSRQITPPPPSRPVSRPVPSLATNGSSKPIPEPIPALDPAQYSNGKHTPPTSPSVVAYPVNGHGAVNGHGHAAAILAEHPVVTSNNGAHPLSLEQHLAETSTQLAQKEMELEQIFRAQAVQNEMFAQLRQELATQEQENNRLQQVIRQQNEEMFLLEQAARTRIQALEHKLSTLQSRFQQTSLTLYRHWQGRDSVSEENES